MADTKPDIVIPAKTWVNLYSTTGITVGTAVTVYNKGNQTLSLAIKSTAPSAPADGVSAIGYLLATFPNAMSFASVPASQSGLWAWSEWGTRVLVQD